MKHGDKAKKSAKASGKQDRKVASHSSKASQSKQASPKAAAVPKSSGNGKVVARSGPVVNGGFSNGVVAAAFKRAIKKYATAFRRLTD